MAFWDAAVVGIRILIALGLVAYVYGGYDLLLWLLSRLFPSRDAVRPTEAREAVALRVVHRGSLQRRGLHRTTDPSPAGPGLSTTGAGYRGVPGMRTHGSLVIGTGIKAPLAWLQ